MRPRRQLASVLRRVPLVMDFATWAYRLMQVRSSVGVAGVVINKAGHVLVVEHVYHARYPWGLPGGWLDRGESPHVGLRRECREELGLAVEVVKPVLVERVTRFAHIDIIYYCRPLGEITALSAELLRAVWAPPGRLPPISPVQLRGVTAAVHEHRLED
jgi:ADP-ribose pyrophosphatase YjhB (NUDIX family)